MSWQLASFLLLALALAGGFAWYERSHPSSRVLALVGTLAALAVLGRIAFAAVPNVKPTTDIVLLAGYVFGGAPGFAVGAVTALASNLFFTQGPWTPWQMGAWGAVGVLGALLARATARRRTLGRIPLALACGLAGLAYSLVVNFGSVVTVGDQDLWGRFAAFQAASLPFDLAHAIGNVAFCLLFGPALVRTLQRFRTRFEFTWLPAPAGPAAGGAVAAGRGAAPAAGGAAPARHGAARLAPPLLVAVALAAAAAATLAPPPPSARAAARATPVSYLERSQNRDGGFGAAPGQSSVDLFTGWVALGLAAQGRNPQDVRRGGRSVLDHVRARARGLTRAGAAPETVGDLERTIMVVVAAGRNPRAFAGQDLVAELRRRFSPDGSMLRQTNLTAFGLLALRAARVPVRDGRVSAGAVWLARQQNRDGGWGFATRGGGSDVDDTAAVVQALAASGRARGAAVRRAVAFLRANQNPDGGFPLLPGQASNAMSTGWALQALSAAGVRPAGVRRRGGRSPLAYLRSLVTPSGMVQFSRTSRQTPVWTTGSVAVALAGRRFPLPPARRGAAGAAGAAHAADRADGEGGGGGSAAGVIVPVAAALGVAGGAAALLLKRR